MAEDTEISDQFKEGLQRLADAAAESEPLPLESSLVLKESTENEAGTAATSPAHSQGGPSSNRESPDPSCSICLGKLENKSFTDSCCHTFCFACLLEWSKVRAVCPLCKVRFKSIVHNVRSNDDYDQYYIGRTSSHIQWPMAAAHRNFSLTTAIPQLSHARARMSVRFLGVEEHRFTYAPHSVQLVSRSISHDLTQQEPRNIQFRRRVYAENLWAKRTTLTSRVASPAYYRANQACTHRLVPWLTRELIVLLNSEQRVGFILDFMMSLILRFSILSEEFFIHVEPYLGNHTTHFVHEFYSFAISIYEIERYDELTQYDSQNQTTSSPESGIIALDSSDSDDHPLAMSVSPGLDSPDSSLPGQSRSRRHTKINSKRPLTKIFLKKTHEKDVWNVVLPPSLSPSPTSSFPETVRIPPSSRAHSDASASTSTSVVPLHSPSVITLSSGEESMDEVLIVDEVKPRWMRTPEVIELTSSPASEIERPDDTPVLPDLEPVSDGSLEIMDDSDAPFLVCSISPVINVPDSSQALSPFNFHEATVDHRNVTPRESRPSKLASAERKRHVSSWSRRWSSSSSSSSRSRSRERNFRSWSQSRENLSSQLFSKKRLSDGSGLHFSETSEHGESSRVVRMPGRESSDWGEAVHSSSSSGATKKKKLRSVVKMTFQCSRSDSSSRSCHSKKPKSKKKKKKSDRHKRHKH